MSNTFKAQPIRWIDTAKSFAIFMVVLGHSAFLPHHLRAIIYAFHVPLFIFVTGYLFAQKRVVPTWLELTKDRIAPLFKLYIFFSAVSVLSFAISTYSSGSPLTRILDSIAGVAVGVSGPDRGFLHINSPLWYFPFLIVSLLLARVVMPLPLLMGGVFIFIFAEIGLRFPDIILPWYFNFAGIGGFFFWLGWTTGLYEHSYPVRLGVLVSVFLTIVFFCTMIGIVWLNGSTNINRGEFGRFGELFLCSAVLGILGTMIASRLVPENTMISTISRNTLVIFCLHIFPLRLIETVVSPLVTSLPLQVVVALASALFAMAITTLISMRLLPWLNRWVTHRGTN